MKLSFNVNLLRIGVESEPQVFKLVPYTTTQTYKQNCNRYLYNKKLVLHRSEIFVLKTVINLFLFKLLLPASTPLPQIRYKYYHKLDPIFQYLVYTFGNSSTMNKTVKFSANHKE